MSKAIPRTIISAFVLFCSGAIYMVYLSTQNPNELVDEQYYAQSMEHDAVMEARSNAMSQSATAWQDPDNKGVLLFTADKPNWHKVDISFVRPSKAALDKDVYLNTQDDTVAVDISSLSPGLWHLNIRWEGDEGTYHHEQDIMITQ